MGKARGAAKQAVAERLPMLAVFALPTGATALALRGERYALTRLVRRVVGSYGRAVELATLQYGVTASGFGGAARRAGLGPRCFGAPTHTRRTSIWNVPNRR
jgi:hypothetical protein